MFSWFYKSAPDSTKEEVKTLCAIPADLNVELKATGTCLTLPTAQCLIMKDSQTNTTFIIRVCVMWDKKVTIKKHVIQAKDITNKYNSTGNNGFILFMQEKGFLVTINKDCTTFTLQQRPVRFRDADNKLMISTATWTISLKVIPHDLVCVHVFAFSSKSVTISKFNPKQQTKLTASEDPVSKQKQVEQSFTDAIVVEVK
jgi:hypothetical protein